MFELYIDGALYDDPPEWRQIDKTTSIEDKFIGDKVEAEITLYGAAARYLFAKYREGICNTVEADVFIKGNDDALKLWHRGIIFLPEVVFNLTKLSAEVTISDNSYFAKIRNNKAMRFQLDVGRSLNDTTITAATYDAITFFDISAGTDLGDTRDCIKAFDAFTFLVAAMTDGAVTFESEVFDTGGELEGVYITTGEEIRSFGGEPPIIIAFEELFSQLNKSGNLIYWIVDNAGVPAVKMERQSSRYSNTQSIELTGVRDVSYSMDAGAIYSTVSVGSGKTRKSNQDTPNTLFPDLAVAGWNDEKLYVTGECGSGVDLDLQGRELVIDSNSIENQLNANDDYDDEIFLVEVDVSTSKAKKYQLIDSIGGFYNEIFSGQKAVESWADSLTGTVGLYRGEGDDNFEAEGTIQQTFTGISSNNIIRFADEISDPNGNYDNAVGQMNYTIPSTGLYGFSVGFFKITNNNVSALGNDAAEVYLRHYDSGSTLIAEYLLLTLTLNDVSVEIKTEISTYISTFTKNTLIYGDGTDYVVVELDGVHASLDCTVEITNDIAETRFFKTYFTSNDSGTIDVGTDARVKNVAFSHPLSLDDYESITPQGYIAVTGYSDYDLKDITVNGHIKSLVYKPLLGTADFELFLKP